MAEPGLDALLPLRVRVRVVVVVVVSSSLTLFSYRCGEPLLPLEYVMTPTPCLVLVLGRTYCRPVNSGLGGLLFAEMLPSFTVPVCIV